MTDFLKAAVLEANKSSPEAVRSELYNAALEAIDDHEAAQNREENEMSIRLYEALKAWTDLEYREHVKVLKERAK